MKSIHKMIEPTHPIDVWVEKKLGYFMDRYASEMSYEDIVSFEDSIRQFLVGHAHKQPHIKKYYT